MTREEAAKVLKLERDSWRENLKLKVDQRLYDAVDIAIKELEARWIPVSERLPEKSGAYLAYIINPSDDECRYIMTCEFFVNDPYPWCPDDETASDNVVAWMPLPEEYKTESEE
jgi:hypothetical protein